MERIYNFMRNFYHDERGNGVVPEKRFLEDKVECIIVGGIIVILLSVGALSLRSCSKADGSEIGRNVESNYSIQQPYNPRR